ncbi:MAG TPA: MlaD family protein [Accumulibacter sp.]|nr:MlaD family protein [Accumulibacter sp.]HMW17469.1 MlaD family protein [Accumulibacter sp.]HMX21704.1 MlaD family protein [Accumulibacter sp.]HMY06313.1 MlaD family protein [Accumulibacter sp.]HNC17777.1 MlaD family protein [Accumulibacter sp.]
MENRSHALAAGLFAVLLGAVTALAFWWFGGRHEATQEFYVVTRQNVTGLNLQGQVRYRGIRVGKVQAIDLDPDDAANILVRISINKSVPMTHGTTARLGYQGITGIAHILLEQEGGDLTPLPGGAPVASLLGGNPVLPRITMRPSLIQELSETGGATLRQARDLLANANEVLDSPSFDNIVANLEATTASTRAIAARLEQLLTPANVRSLQTTLAHAGQAAAEAAPLMSELRQLTGRLRLVSERLDKLIADPGGQGVGTLLPRLNDLGNDLTANSQQLGRVLQMLEDSPQSLVFGRRPQPPGPGEPGFVVPGSDSRARP